MPLKADYVPVIQISTIRNNLRVAVTNISFNCPNNWYEHFNGSALCASVSIIL